MASTQISGSTLSLHGAPNKTDHERNNSNSLRTGILVRLNDQVIRDLQQCAHGGKAVQLLGGKTPKIRYGAKLLELNVRPETFRHEIYSTDDNSNQLDFAAFVSHHAELRVPVEKKAQEDSAGAEAALETLKQSLASMAKQKEERKTTISSSVTAGGKNSRYLQPSSRPTSLASSSSTPRPAAPTSAPSDPHAQAREKGMRFALIHLLAVRPLSEQDIHQKTHIPKAQLSSLLSRIADKQGLIWELSNKPYKELDPWSFKYTSDQRTLAINNAIRAFDRARIPKDDKAWQILLPKEERNKGKILSRLHLTAERADLAGTPGLASTPIHTSAAATPKLGSIGTPRSGSGATATGRSAAGISIEKRLKEAKKKGAMEKKKQEKEAKEAAAAASDRESKPRNVTAKRPIPPKKVVSRVKSDEVVHSSDDEEEGEVKEDSSLKKSTTSRKEPPKAAPKVRPAATERRDSSASEAPGPSKDSKIRSKPLTSDKFVTNTASRKDSAISKVKSEAPLLAKAAALPKKPETSTTANAATKSKDSPAQKPVKTTSTTQRSNISPRRLTDTKPKVPSPLGTSPPRNASDNAEKTIKQPPKPSATTNAAKLARPTPTSKASEPLSFFGGVKTGSQSKIVTKKRPLESDTESAEPARKAVKSTTSTPAKAPTSKPAKASVANGNGREAVTKAPPAHLAASDKSLKRKANDLSSGLHDHAAPPSSKHRKTDSGSTHSHTATSSSGASLTTAPTVSPHSSPAGSDFSDDNLAGVLNDEYDGGSLTWEQTRAAAETFRSKLYPEYLKLYRRIEQTPSDKVAKEDTVRLWQLHNRLEAIKHRIEVACRDGDKGGD
ncbi:hypothetical protein KCU71_g7138, partial [Aureobasidium melanogenum]